MYITYLYTVCSGKNENIFVFVIVAQGRKQLNGLGRNSSQIAPIRNLITDSRSSDHGLLIDTNLLEPL